MLHPRKPVSMNPFQFIWRYRNLIWHTTLNDVRMRYIGSVLGLAWAVLNPLLILGLYVVVYLMIFKIQMPGMSSEEYVVAIFAGLIPWFGFSEAVTASLNAIVSNSNLVRTTSFPARIFPGVTPIVIFTTPS